MTTKPQSTTEPLLPCPFCASADLDLSNGYDEDANWVVICRGCKSSGTFCVEKSKAIARWNTRPSPASTAPVVDNESAKTVAETLNREGWLLADATSEELDKVAAIIQASTPSATDDLISRTAAKAALCHMCAKPDRYKPAQPIEGSRRLFHFQGSENWNAGQCFAQAIDSVPAAATAAPQQPRSNHFPDEALNKGFPDHISRDGTAYYSDGAVLPSAAPVEQKTFKNTKEAMLYAQRNNIPAVIPVSDPSTSARAAAEQIAKYIEASTPLSLGGALVRTFENIIRRHCSAPGPDQC